MLLRHALLAIPLAGCFEMEPFPPLELGFPDDFEPTALFEDDGTNLFVRTCQLPGWFTCGHGEGTVELTTDGQRIPVPEYVAPIELGYLLATYSHEVIVPTPTEPAVQLSSGTKRFDVTLVPRFTATAPDAFVRSERPLLVETELLADHDRWIRVTSYCGDTVDVRDVDAETRTSIDLSDLLRVPCMHLVQSVQERADHGASVRRVVRLVVASDP